MRTKRLATCLHVHVGNHGYELWVCPWWNYDDKHDGESMATMERRKKNIVILQVYYSYDGDIDRSHDESNHIIVYYSHIVLFPHMKPYHTTNHPSRWSTFWLIPTQQRRKVATPIFFRILARVSISVEGAEGGMCISACSYMLGLTKFIPKMLSNWPKIKFGIVWDISPMSTVINFDWNWQLAKVKLFWCCETGRRKFCSFVPFWYRA